MSRTLDALHRVAKDMYELKFLKRRFKCANCGFVFDENPAEQELRDIHCPKCNSNACDERN